MRKTICEVTEDTSVIDSRIVVHDVPKLSGKRHVRIFVSPPQEATEDGDVVYEDDSVFGRLLPPAKSYSSTARGTSRQ